MITFLKIVAKLAKYGAKAVSYAWDHKAQILRFIERQLAIDTIINWVLDKIGY